MRTEMEKQPASDSPAARQVEAPKSDRCKPVLHRGIAAGEGESSK